MKATFLLILLTVGCAVADKVLIGYFPNWLGSSWPVSKINFSKYTHINYAFAEMTGGDVPEWPDKKLVDVQLPQVVKAAHAKKAKVLISVGGWSGSRSFSTMVSSSSRRKRFIDWQISQIKKFNIDGIDIDWEYPGTQGQGCNTVNINSDTTNFLKLIKELRSSLDKTFGTKKKEITIATHVNTFVTPAGNMKDVSAFAKVLDRINIMIYDINGAWGANTGPNAPFNYQSGQGSISYVSSIQTWLDAGVPANKLVAGIAFYGRATTAKQNMLITGSQYQPQITGKPAQGDSLDGPWKDSSCPADAGSRTGIWRYGKMRSQGLLSSATKAVSPWVRTWDNVSQTPWLFNPKTKTYITYDDPASIAVKVNHALCKNLGGVMIWSAEQDSSNGELLNAVYAIRTKSKPSVCPI
ncbi:glycoside hydrolase superfamily [Phycomyces nitens]|nr:glycoside hydrolase superfamily [Phycomyces nitens]